MFNNNNTGNANKNIFSNMASNSANNPNTPNPNQGNTPSNPFAANNQNNPNKPNSIFSGNNNTSTNVFANNQNNTNSTPQGGSGGLGNMANNSAPQNKPNSIFSNTPNPTYPSNNTPVNPPSTNLFTKANNTNNFLNQNSQPNQNVTPGQNNPIGPTNVPNASNTTNVTHGIFGVTNISNNPNTNTANMPQTSNQGPTTNAFPSNPQPSNTPGGGNIFKNQANNPTPGNTGPSAQSIPATTGNKLFSNNQQNTPNTTGNTPNPPSNQQNPGANLFVNKPTVTNPQQTNTNTGAPSTGATLFTNNQTTANTTNAQTNPPSTNLFTQNNPTAQNNPAPTTGGTTGTTNLFNQGNQPAQSNPIGGTGIQGNLGPNLSQPRDDIQTQLDKSNQSVAEFIDDFKKIFLNNYQDLQKLSESALRYLDEKDQNQRLIRNFNIMEPMITNRSQVVLRTLEGMARQQEEIENTINMMSRRLGEGHYVHELSHYLEDYQQIKEQMLNLQEQGGDWSDPSNQQLADIFQNLNLVEMQIREMDQQVERYLSSLDNYL